MKQLIELLVVATVFSATVFAAAPAQAALPTTYRCDVFDYGTGRTKPADLKLINPNKASMYGVLFENKTYESGFSVARVESMSVLLLNSIFATSQNHYQGKTLEILMYPSLGEVFINNIVSSNNINSVSVPIGHGFCKKLESK